MSIYYVAGIPYSDELYHHGIKGQKWGIRRYQNEDGSLTPAGQKRYGSVENYEETKREDAAVYNKHGRLNESSVKGLARAAKEKFNSNTRGGAVARGVARQAAIAVGARVAGAVLAAYAVKKVAGGSFYTDPKNAATVAAGAALVNGLLIGATVGNVVKTVKDYKKAPKKK